MINLRYHIVSIVAVFLALGIGVAMGTSFIDGVIVNQLESRVEDLETSRDDAEEEAEQLREALAADEAADTVFQVVGSGSLFTRRLDGVPVMIFAADGVDDADIALARRALASSAADYGGVVTISEAFDLEDPDRREVLARVLRVDDDPESETDPLREELSRRLGLTLLPEAPLPGAVVAGSRQVDVAAAVLADPADPPLGPVPDVLGPGDDLLSDLLAAGFVAYDPSGVISPDLGRLPRAGSRFLLIGSPESGAAALDVMELIVLQLLRAEPPPVVVASTAVAEPGEDPFLDRFRGDGAFAGAESTVDGLADLQGVSAAVLALDGIGLLAPDDYGRRSDASALLPVR